MAVPDGDWVVIAKLQAYRAHISRTKPPILEVGFSRQCELCEHFLFGNRKTEHHRKRTEMTDDSRRCFVVVHTTDSIEAGSVLYSPGQKADSKKQPSSGYLSLPSSDFKVPQLGNVVVSLCGASGNTLYWILLLIC
jgi:hypothetical protein